MYACRLPCCRRRAAREPALDHAARRDDHQVQHRLGHALQTQRRGGRGHAVAARRAAACRIHANQPAAMPANDPLEYCMRDVGAA